VGEHRYLSIKHHGPHKSFQADRKTREGGPRPLKPSRSTRSTNPEGLQVVDVRTPSFPAEVGFAELLPLAEDVATSGRYPYVVVGTGWGEEDGLHVFDGWGCRPPWQRQMPPALE